MELDYRKIGSSIARRRRELHMKQAEVCERAGINDKYLSCIERAHSIPSLEVFLRICEALSTTPDHILIGSVSDSAGTQMQAALFDKFRRLTPDQQQLCLAFMDMLHDSFGTCDTKNS